MRDTGCSDAIQHAIDLQSVTYQVDQTRLLDIRSLSFGPIGTTAIMGPNGAGKSLLLRLVHGLVAPTGGKINVNGSSLTDDHRKVQALVFQKPVLLRRSVEANIAFVLKARGLPQSRTQALLKRVGLAEKAARPARRLSGGEQQRLAMARALATEPHALFLDEPTASLDPTSAKAIEEIIKGVAAEGVRVLIITHDAAQAKRLADDIVFLHRGKVVEHAGAANFVEAPGSKLAAAYLAGELDELVEE